MPVKAQNAKQTDEAAQKRVAAKPAIQEPVALSQQADLETLQRAVANPRVARPSDILALQRTVGNHATGHLIQTKLTVGAAGDRYEQEADRVAEQVMNMTVPSSVATGEAGRGPQPVQRAAEEEEEVQTKPLAASITPLVQRQTEEEEEVQTKPLLQRQAEEEEEVQTKSLGQEEEEPIQGKPVESVQRVGEEEEEEPIQGKPIESVQRVGEEEEEEPIQGKLLAQRAVQNPEAGFEASDELASRLAANRGGGSPLSSEVRAYMEPRFGTDFSGVRVHTGGEAVEMNREIGARAFTHGQDIYLGEQAGTLTSNTGRQLLAHELTHTLQQGASKRISGWWADSHKMITLQTGYKLVPQYDKGIVEWLADHAGSLDMTLRSMSNFAIYAGLFQKGANNKFQSKDTPLLEKKKLWETGGLMVRWEKERPFHGEATAYTDGANKITENKKAVNDQLAKAKGAYESGFYREGLLQLSDALHTAEDRGSHGDGMPWSGHDPRLKMPLKWDGTPNENYREGWDCDNPGKNPGGRELGEYFATETFEKFLQDLNFESKLKVAMGIGAKKTSFNWGRDWGSRIFHNFRTFGLGTLFGAVGGKVLEPSEDVVRDLDEYQKIKAAYPSVDIKQLLQFANQGERGTESAQGFASYKTEHLKQVRDTVKNQLIQIIQGVQGNMDPFAMESQYKMFSKLQAMSREYDAAIAGVDPKSTERDLGAQLIEQDAADWKDKANKYSSLIRKIVRIGRNAERETLKASILDRAPEHLNFVNGQIALASR